MKKIHEYRQHADECRAMAKTASPEHKAQLENMAQTWDQLAEARKRKLAREGKAEQDDLD